MNVLPFRIRLSDYTTNKSGNEAKRLNTIPSFLHQRSGFMPKGASFTQKSPLRKQRAFCVSGGGEGNRTPVRKHADTAFSERSHDFDIPSAQRLMTGFGHQ